MRWARARRSRTAIVLLGLVVVVLGLAQASLPALVASRIRSRVGRYGAVHSVGVSMWPAVEALWGRVDSVTVRAGALSLSPVQAAALLAQAHGVARMDVSATGVSIASLALTDATLRKRGSSLSAQAFIGAASVQAALPAGFHLRLLASERGQVRVRVTGGLFGLGGSLEAVALASEGKLIAYPLDPRLRALRLTLFSDPRIEVQAVGASVASRRPLTYRLTMLARLR